MLYRQPGDVLILRSTQDQDRNPGRCEKEPIERLDSVAVGQEEVDQHRRDAVRSLLSFPRQAFQSLGTASNPYDLEGPIARVDQRFSNGIGIRGIVLDQKYVLRHKILPAHQDARLPCGRRSRPARTGSGSCGPRSRRASSTPNTECLPGRTRTRSPSTRSGESPAAAPVPAPPRPGPSSVRPGPRTPRPPGTSPARPSGPPDPCTHSRAGPSAGRPLDHHDLDPPIPLPAGLGPLRAQEPAPVPVAHRDPFLLQPRRDQCIPNEMRPALAQRLAARGVGRSVPARLPADPGTPAARSQPMDAAWPSWPPA